MGRLKSYRLYKIPGRVDKVPDDIWENPDLVALLPYLEAMYSDVKLPPVSNKSFRNYFKRIAGCFPDKASATQNRWKDRGIWFVCSFGLPSWVLIENRSGK